MSNAAGGEEAIMQASTATAGIQTTLVTVSFQYYLVAFIQTINIILLLSFLSSFYFSTARQI
jgi:hypothetical protein